MLSNTQSAFSLWNPLTRLVSTSLGRNTVWGLAGYGLRLMLQAAYFIIIARCLGPKQYGAFIAATALGAVISPFVGLGSGNLLIKNVARDARLFHEYWGNGLLMTLLSGLALTSIAVSLCRVVLPHTIPLMAIFLLAISDLIFVKFLDMAAWAFQGFERLSNTAALNVLVSLTRLVGIAGLALRMSHPSMLAWAAIYFAGSVLAATTGVVWVTLTLGAPKLALHRLRGEGSEGFYFSFSLSAQTIYNDIDKTMMARLSTLDAAGIYAAAYRLIDVAFIPVRALLNAAYPGFFRTGADGLQASMKYGQGLLRRILPYSLFTFAALMIAAPIVPHILGRDYARVTEALRWLALLPLLKTGHYFIADSLTGAGHQGLRTAIQTAVAVFNILINLWVIPLYGWRGAACSSLASDGLLLLGLWLAATYLRRTTYLGCQHIAVEVALAGRS
jgi:O-antigen/teichoic acid export membrane protein